MTLEEKVRYYIGASGPQHESKEDYEAYIDDRLEYMSNADLLFYISLVMEEEDERR